MNILLYNRVDFIEFFQNFKFLQDLRRCLKEFKEEEAMKEVAIADLFSAS